MAKSKSENNIQERDIKTKPSTKKSKKVETEKIEKIDDVKVVEDNVQVDVEIDCRSCNHSDVVSGYIRRKRSI